MCFSPQLCAIFRHQNFKKCSRMTVFNIFTSKRAFRHSGVQFFRHQNFKNCSENGVFCTFSLPHVLFATAACNFWFLLWAPTSAPGRFNRRTFWLTWHTNHWKNTAIRDFSNIWRGCILFLLTFALLHLLSADLTTLLCFSTVHIVGSLLFKLPSITLDDIKLALKTTWT